jgi:hypothetical protein
MVWTEVGAAAAGAVIAGAGVGAGSSGGSMGRGGKAIEVEQYIKKTESRNKNFIFSPLIFFRIYNLVSIYQNFFLKS